VNKQIAKFRGNGLSPQLHSKIRDTRKAVCPNLCIWLLCYYKTTTIWKSSF